MIQFKLFKRFGCARWSPLLSVELWWCGYMSNVLILFFVNRFCIFVCLFLCVRYHTIIRPNLDPQNARNDISGLQVSKPSKGEAPTPRVVDASTCVSNLIYLLWKVPFQYMPPHWEILKKGPGMITWQNLMRWHWLMLKNSFSKDAC